jgi:hypothetical protein
MCEVDVVVILSVAGGVGRRLVKLSAGVGSVFKECEEENV